MLDEDECIWYFFFFFKQKTAYEIYQCDWSSDVCSSDLVLRMRTRDFEDHEDRNFERAVDSLRAAGDAHYDVIRHTHWAVGWVEFIVFDPESSAVVEIVNKMIRRRKSEDGC